MLAKTVQERGANWDTRLPYMRFTYRSSLQESPFYLLYGRDQQLPSEEMLTPQERTPLDIGSYTEEAVTKRMQDALKKAQEQVRRAQKRQKQLHDRHARPDTFTVGERVFVYMPAKVTGKMRKFTRLYHRPYRVVESGDLGVVVQPVSDPKARTIGVSLERVSRCPTGVPDDFRPSKHGRGVVESPGEDPIDSTPEGVLDWAWSGRLQPPTG